MGCRPLLAVLVGLFLLGVLLSGCAVADASYEVKTDNMIRPIVNISTSSGSYGSGVVFFSEDYTLIITAYHVISQEAWIKADINGEIYEVTIVKEDIDLDLAVLRAEMHTDFVAHIHKEVTLHPFDKVYLVGAGQSEDPYPTLGIISIPLVDDKDSKRHELVQISAPVVGGTSGGAIYRRHHDHYEWVGLVDKMALQRLQISYNYAVGAPVNNMAFAIPIAVVKTFIGGSYETPDRGA